MKKLIVKSNVVITDVFNDSWCSTPSTLRIIDTLEKTLKRCISEKGTVDLFNLRIDTEEVEQNADN